MVCHGGWGRGGDIFGDIVQSCSTQSHWHSYLVTSGYLFFGSVKYIWYLTSLTSGLTMIQCHSWNYAKKKLISDNSNCTNVNAKILLNPPIIFY